MKRKFDLVWDKNNPIATFYGIINLADILEANDMVIGDRRFDSMEYQIFDYSKIERMDLTDDMATIIAKLDNTSTSWNRKVRVATITPDPNLKAHIEEYNKLMESSPWETKTFHTFGEGLTWCIRK